MNWIAVSKNISSLKISDDLTVYIGTSHSPYAPDVVSKISLTSVYIYIRCEGELAEKVPISLNWNKIYKTSFFQTKGAIAELELGDDPLDAFIDFLFDMGIQRKEMI